MLTEDHRVVMVEAGQITAAAVVAVGRTEVATQAAVVAVAGEMVGIKEIEILK